jgi:hypothetical protein
VLGSAVVALVQQDCHITGVSQSFGHRLPVVKHAEQAMKQDDGFSLANDFIVELQGHIAWNKKAWNVKKCKIYNTNFIRLLRHLDALLWNSRQ